jgi:hypothetical protein
MSVYVVTAPNGQKYRVNAPEGTSAEELSDFVYSKYYEDEARRNMAERRRLLEEADTLQAPEDEETTLVGNIFRGVGAGAVNTLEMAALGAITPLGEESEASARDVIKSVADFVRPRLANPEEVSAKLAQGIGSILGFAPALLAGPAALPAAAFLGASAGAGEASERARAKDATQEQRNVATRLGVIPGLFDVLPLGRFARAAGIDIGDVPVIGDMINKLGPDAVDGMLSRVQRAGISGGIEGAQEAAQSIAQNLIEQGYSPETPTFGGTLEEGLIGGGAGAIFQGLLDLAVGRRQRGPSAPGTEEQGELFPGADLGTAPTAPGPEQGELFPTEDLGRAPEEDTQLDLFGPRASQAAALRQRIRDLELERQRTIRSPMAPFEEAGDPFLERTKAEIDQARAQLAELEGRVEPQQRELPFEDVPGGAAEQAAQAAARERAGLVAAERGDEAAFDQPDLFALQQEQEARRLGTPRFPVDQFMDVQEEAEVTPPPDPRQYELEDAIELQRMIDEEAAATRAEETAARELRTESELETIAGQQDTTRQATTEQRRGEVLNSVLSDLSTASRANTARRFSAALSDAGVANTAPTAAELRTITRATDAFAAGRPAPAVEETAPEIVTGPPEATQLEEMEARIPERRTTPRTPEQPSFPGMGRRGTAPAVPAEPAPEPRILGEAELDRLQIPKNAPIRKRITGKDFNDPEIRQQLIDFAKNPRASQAARFNIDRLVRNTPEEQMDLFPPRRGGPRRTAAEPRDVQTEAATAPETEATSEQLSLFGDDISLSDVDAARRRTRVPPTVRGRRGVAGDAAPTTTEADAGRLGAATSNVVRAITGEGGERTTVTPIPESKAAPKPEAAPKKAAPTPTPRRTAAAKKPVTEKKEAPKQAFTGPKRTQAEIELMRARSYQGYMSPRIEERLRTGEYGVGTEEVSAAASQVQKVYDTDPTTEKDVEVVLKLVQDTKPKSGTKANNKEAAAHFFGRRDGVRAALEEMIYAAALYKKGDYRRAPDETLADKQMFEGMGAVNARKAMKWVEENLSPETNAWLDNALQYYSQAATRINAASKYVDPVQAARDRAKAESDLLELPADSVANLEMPLHPLVRIALQRGDLKTALRTLVKTAPSDRVAQIAGKLLKVVGDTKVELVKGLKGADGTPAAGLFDPKTNTIKLNSDMGDLSTLTDTSVDTHTLLHEVTHAAVSATLANKNSPVTKQLTKLFEDVKDSLGTYYGATSLDEFVSEAFSNPEFQRTLAGLNPDGSNISALQRFLNTVGNFVRKLLGMQVKPVGSALNAADTLIDSILSAAPDYRNAGELLMNSTYSGVKAAMQKVGNVQKNFSSPITKQQRERFANSAVEFLQSGVAGVAKRFLLGSLGTKSLGDVAMRAGLGDIGVRLHELIERQRGAIQDVDKRVADFISNTFVPWADKHAEVKAALDRVIYSGEYGATIYQVDPTKPRSAYEGKTDDSGNDLAAIWDEQRADWAVVQKAGGVRIFNGMRKVYADQYEKLRKVIYGEIDALMANDPAAATRLKNEVYAKLFESGRLEVYFPLIRQGRYKLSYSMKNPKSPREAYVVRMFDTKRERDRVMAEVKADPDVAAGSIESVDGEMAVKDFRNAPPTSFVGDTLKVMTANNVPVDVQEQIMRLFVEALPETSFAKSLQRRKGTPGYIQDSLIGLRTKAYDIGRQAVRLEYGARLRDMDGEIAELQESKLSASESLVGKTKDTIMGSFNDVRAELLARSEFARSGAKNKGAERFYKTANQGAFIYTIGFNTSSALVQLSQIPLFALPYMTAKYGPKASGAIVRATKFSKLVIIPALPTMRNGKLRAGNTDQIDNYYDVDADGNYTVKSGLNLDANTIAQLRRMAPMVKTASERAYLGRSYLMEQLGLEEGGRARQGGTASRVLDSISTASAIGFNAVERFNRQTIMFSNFDLILDRLDSGERYFAETQGKYVDPSSMDSAQKEQLAADEALYQTEQLNGGLALETAPRIAQQGIGRVALMYKSYGMNMYYTMLKSASRMLDSSVDPAMRKQAMYELIGVHGSSLFFAGIHGVPIYGIFTMVANMFLDDEEDDADTIVRKYIGEGWYKGPINELLGIDVASRVRLNNLLIQDNRYNAKPSPEEFIGFYLGGPALSTGKRLVRGVTDLQEGFVERGIENLLPPAVANAYKATFGRYARDGGAFTRRGDPIYDDITTGELVGQVFGFAPSNYTFEQERNAATKRMDRNISDRRTKALRKMYMAYRMGDYEDYQDAMKEIMEFNRRYAGSKVVITPDTLKKSIDRHRTTSVEMYNGITISPNLRSLLIEHRNEWGQ